MRNVLCYGDSNTWGFDPATKQRFGHEVRWPGVLQHELGDGWRVIEEGLNGRTTAWTDPIVEYRNGKHLLMPTLDSHKPLDLVIVMLGTNDCKLKFSAPSCEIAKGMSALVEIAQKSGTGVAEGPPEVLIVSPPLIANLTEFAEIFEGAEKKSERLPEFYRAVAAERKCHFFEAGSVIRTSPLDGVHFDAAEHKRLGVAMAEQVRRAFQTPDVDAHGKRADH